MNLNLTLAMQALIFALFIWFCAAFIWPALMRAIAARQKEIADGLAAGEEGRQSLGRAEKQIAQMLSDAKVRASEIVSQGEKFKSDTIEQARREAKAESDRIVASARAEIEQEVQRAKDALRDQVAELAVAGARKILGREVDAKTHADLLATLQRQ